MFGVLLHRAIRAYLYDPEIRQIATDHVLNLVKFEVLVAFLLAFLIFPLTLTLLVSRRCSKIAMWVSIAMAAYGIWLVVSGIVHEPLLGSNIIPALQCVGQAVAYGLLFTLSARRWMNREDEKEREASGARTHHFT